MTIQEIKDTLLTGNLSALATKSGYHVNNLYRWKAGQVNMTIQSVLDLAQTQGYKLTLEPNDTNQRNIK
jgi:DNA-binding phage protein